MGIPGMTTDGSSLYDQDGQRVPTFRNQRGQLVPVSFVDANGNNRNLSESEMQEIQTYQQKLMREKGASPSEAFQMAADFVMRRLVEPVQPFVGLNEIEPLPGP